MLFLQIGETRMPDLTDLDRVDPAVASVVISCLQVSVMAGTSEVQSVPFLFFSFSV